MTDGNNEGKNQYQCDVYHRVTDDKSGKNSLLGPPNPSSHHLGLRELNFELLHLFPELSDDASVGVFVHHGVVDDSLGSVGIAQRGQSLLVVIGRWTHCGNHGGLAVAAKVVLKTRKRSWKDSCYSFPSGLHAKCNDMK